MICCLFSKNQFNFLGFQVRIFWINWDWRSSQFDNLFRSLLQRSTSSCRITIHPSHGGNATSPSVTFCIHVPEIRTSLQRWSADATLSEWGTIKSINSNLLCNTDCEHVCIGRTYVDAVINHMSGLGRLGVSYAGSPYDGDALDFPGSVNHFTICDYL